MTSSPAERLGPSAGLSSFTLHLLAMLFMLCDHLWATFLGGVTWMSHVGRIAFPIFAFMLAEGFFHTKDVRKYRKRLILFALLSEIPFNLMMARSLFYPIHQNVLWTFLLGVFAMEALEKRRDRGLLYKAIFYPLVILGFYLLGIIGFVDYYGYGILMILLFYFTRRREGDTSGRRLWKMALQAVGLYWINCELMKGLLITVPFFGEIHQQGLALLALLPIWLYNGRQGPYNKAIRALYYWFYPVHMLLLGGTLALFY